jgi:hypothetical protein
MLQAGRSRDRIPDEVDFFNLLNPSSRTTALGSTQPLTEMSTRNIPGGEVRPARKADNLTAICELTVYKMCKPQHLTTLWVSRPVTGIPLPTFTLTYTCINPYCFISFSFIKRKNVSEWRYTYIIQYPLFAILNIYLSLIVI